MKHVVVNPGVCGLTADIKAEKTGSRTVKLTVQTDCKMIAEMAGRLGEEVKAFDLLGMSRGEHLLDTAREGIRIHAACPVIPGIAKAVEAECELALPRDATISFVD